MSSRDSILKAIAEHLPPSKPLPELPRWPVNSASLKSQFCTSVLAGGAEWVGLEAIDSWDAFLSKHYPSARRVISTVAKVQAEIIEDSGAWEKPQDLVNVDVMILEGEWGVAENAAIWVPETAMGNRVLPFITQHLVILLKTEHIVGNMHEAYRQIEIDKYGFGVFIAGPSKTADIEQSLVKGAQGARSTLVVLY